MPPDISTLRNPGHFNLVATAVPVGVRTEKLIIFGRSEITPNAVLACLRAGCDSWSVSGTKVCADLGL
jgi:hypothetical protein